MTTPEPPWPSDRITPSNQFAANVGDGIGCFFILAGIALVIWVLGSFGC